MSKLPTPVCIGCNKVASAIPSILSIAREEGVSPETIARGDGTYNHLNGHFLCDLCYIKAGMPSSPTGWRAP